MGEFNTVGLEDIIDAFGRRETATVEAVPKMLKAGADVLIEAQKAEAQAMGLNETGGFINSIKATIKKCESGKITKEQLQKSIQSWTGHAGHADSYNLRKKIETLAEAALEKAA